MSRRYKIAVWPGDGIGPEVTREAIKVLEATDVNFELIEGTVGGRAYVEHGDPLPEEAKKVCDEVDALLLGAVGQDYAPYDVPRKVLTYLRVDRDAYANVRPLKLYPGVDGPCPSEPRPSIDVVIVRDNAEGFALRHEGYFWDDKGYDKRVITSFGAQRIATYALEYAARVGRSRISCVDQSNWLSAYEPDFEDTTFAPGNSNKPEIGLLENAAWENAQAAQQLATVLDGAESRRGRRRLFGIF